MAKAADTGIPVEREGTLRAQKLLMIVLAAAIIWQIAAAVENELRARRLVTAQPFLTGVSRLLVGEGTRATFQERPAQLWQSCHRLVALLVVTAGVVLLVTRQIILSWVLELQYLDPGAQERRLYSGFPVNVFLMTAQAGALYAVAFFARSGRAHLVPPGLVVFLVLNLLWVLEMLLSRKGPERRVPRGLWCLAGTTAATAVAAYCAIWNLEGAAAADKAVRGSVTMITGAGLAILLCSADAYLQYHLHRRGRAGSAA